MARSQNYFITFNESAQVLIAEYGCDVSAEVTRKLYRDLIAMMQRMKPGDVRGIVFDFRQVSHFGKEALRSTCEESERANRLLDMSHMPAALIVQTPRQEQIVRLMVEMTPGRDHRRLVRAFQDALSFIEEWHQRHVTAY